MAVYHMHHIIPKHAGGTDVRENLVKLTIEEHALAHKKLWEDNQNPYDYLAWKALLGLMNKEQIMKEIYRLNGKRNRLNGHMSRVGKSITPEERTKRCKASAEVNRKNKTNAFFDPVHKKRISSLGGKTQGKINAQNGHLKRIAQLPRNRNPKFWVTNGIDNIMLDVGIDIPDGYRNGKTQRKRETL